MGAIDCTWCNQIPERGIPIEMPQIEDIVGIPHIINMALGAAAESKGPQHLPMMHTMTCTRVHSVSILSTHI